MPLNVLLSLPLHKTLSQTIKRAFSHLLKNRQNSPFIPSGTVYEMSRNSMSKGLLFGITRTIVLCLGTPSRFIILPLRKTVWSRYHNRTEFCRVWSSLIRTRLHLSSQKSTNRKDRLLCGPWRRRRTRDN